MFGSGQNDVDEQLRIVELTIRIEDPIASHFRGDRRYIVFAFSGTEPLGLGKAAFACEPVVEDKAHGVPDFFQPGSAWDQEGHFVDDVGCVFPQQSPLVQGVSDEVDVALGQVPYATVDQFGRTARGPFSEIALVDQYDGQSTGSSIQSDARAGGTGTDDDQVPYGLGLEPCDVCSSVEWHDWDRQVWILGKLVLDETLGERTLGLISPLTGSVEGFDPSFASRGRFLRFHGRFESSVGLPDAFNFRVVFPETRCQSG